VGGMCPSYMDAAAITLPHWCLVTDGGDATPLPAGRSPARAWDPPMRARTTWLLPNNSGEGTLPLPQSGTRL